MSFDNKPRLYCYIDCYQSSNHHSSRNRSWHPCLHNKNWLGMHEFHLYIRYLRHILCQSQAHQHHLPMDLRLHILSISDFDHSFNRMYTKTVAFVKITVTFLKIRVTTKFSHHFVTVLVYRIRPSQSRRRDS